MILNTLLGSLYGLVKGIAKQYLYNETVGLAQEMLLADTVSDAAKLFIGAASAGKESFWLDLLILLCALLIVIMLTTCVARFACWICVGIPMAARDIEKIRAGKKDYQIQAQKERKARQQRIENGEEEAFVPVEEDLKEVSELLSQMRNSKQRKNATQSGNPVNDAKGVARSRVKGPQASAAASETSLPKAEVFLATSRRTPADVRATPKSVIRGYPEVDFMLTSPGQHYFLVGCRSKRRTSVYPQSDAAAFMGLGKELQEKYGTDVNSLVTTAVGLEQKAEVFSADFAVDDTRLIVGERFTDTFVCFSISGRSHVRVSTLWSMKLPNHRLVSSVPRWSVFGQDAILSILDESTEVEVLTRGPGETSISHKDKFKVGKALAWAVSDDRIALGGSFLREPRLSRVSQRTAGGDISLELIAVLPHANKVRVSAIAFVTPGAPEFNTRSYLIVFLENGVGTIYSLPSANTPNEPQTVCTFADTDYAAYQSDAPLRMITAVRGKAYHEVLRLALYRGPRVTVYEQSGKADEGNFHMIRLVDLYDVQEGDVIQHAAFLQNGLGLATAGHADCRHVQMFSLPE